MKAITLIVAMLIGVSVNGMPDCSESEEFKSSLYAMLLSELLPINIGSPEVDAKTRFENGDYRLLAYGVYSGIKIPGAELLEKNQICKYGLRIFPGATDAYESSNHRVLVAKLKEYIKKYNAYVLGRLKDKDISQN